MADTPSPWAIDKAKRIGAAMMLAWPESGLRPIARALDAALAEGHRRAVEETAIASVHKAVAAEREAVVDYLRSGGKAWEYAANDVEEGKHHE